MLVQDEKVVNLRGHNAIIVGNLSQHFLQFADRDCWTLRRFWNHGLVSRCGVFSTFRPHSKETARTPSQALWPLWTRGLTDWFREQEIELKK